jgi:hypothetical protein
VQDTPRNSPVSDQKNSPLGLVAYGYHKRNCRRYTKNQQIIQLAESKYHRTGQGITYTDLITAKLSSHKRQAQETLKHFVKKQVLFTLNDQRPQRYYLVSKRANIVENIKNRKNSPSHHTEVKPSVAPLKNLLDQQKSQTFLDILLSLPKIPMYIHKLYLQLSITKESYTDLKGNTVKRNRAKPHQERIGNTIVTYMVYPKGSVIVTIACSNYPFKLETDSDLTILFSYLGQVRDRLIYLLSDISENIVPPITEWVLKECDINKDVEVNNLLQLTLPDIQFSHADRVFRLYVKSMGEKAVYRVEEAMTLDFTLLESLQQIRAPTKILKEQLLEQEEVLTDISDMVVRLVAFMVYHWLRIMFC